MVPTDMHKDTFANPVCPVCRICTEGVGTHVRDQPGKVLGEEKPAAVQLAVRCSRCHWAVTILPACPVTVSLRPAQVSLLSC